LSIVSSAKNLILKSTNMRIAIRGARNYLRKVKYVKRGKSIVVDDKMVMFGAYDGRSYVCSPKAVYEHMISSSEFDDFKFVWYFDNPEKYRFLENNQNTIVVKKGSAECDKYLHMAKYWVFNFRAQDQWIPGEDQIYIQCWHGTPLKRLGYDITKSDNAMNSIREIREKYRTDAQRFHYMVSPCDFVTQKFNSAWNLKAWGKEDAVLQIGYPRNDFLNKFSKEDVEKVKQNLGIEGINKKIILYAPTWRDNQHDADKGYIYDNPVDFDYLRQHLEEEYVILFRAHYLVADNFDFDAYEGFIYNVSNYDDINELYITADILITDYSSVFFDYAILERPMIFYMYDMEAYRDEMRGFYIDVNSLPGPIIRTEKELVAQIRNAEDVCDIEMIKEFNKVYNDMNDGMAAKRLVDAVIAK